MGPSSEKPIDKRLEEIEEIKKEIKKQERFERLYHVSTLKERAGLEARLGKLREKEWKEKKFNIDLGLDSDADLDLSDPDESRFEFGLAIKAYFPRTELKLSYTPILTIGKDVDNYPLYDQMLKAKLETRLPWQLTFRGDDSYSVETKDHVTELKIEKMLGEDLNIYLSQDRTWEKIRDESGIGGEWQINNRASVSVYYGHEWNGERDDKVSLLLNFRF